MTFALVRVHGGRPALHQDTFARAVGAHPDLVPRLVALGLLEATTDSDGELWLDPAQVAVFARIQRLRAGFSLNYAAVGLVADLLDRISELEAALRVAQRRRQGG
jgi:chaperone modulatory protein CbpM